MVSSSDSSQACTVDPAHYLWTGRGLQGLKDNGVFKKYGCPISGSRVHHAVESEPIWPVMLREEWVVLAHVGVHNVGVHGKVPIDVNSRVTRSHVVELCRLEVSDVQPWKQLTGGFSAKEPCSDVPQELSLIVREWKNRNPGCSVDIELDTHISTLCGLPVHSLVHGLLQELNSFDVDPWGPEGINETLKAMRDNQALFAVNSGSMWEKGVKFLSPQVDALGEAALKAGNTRLASFISQAISDVNVRCLFTKIFLPRSLINGSEWHQDQSNEDQQSWSRCLVYLSSAHEGDSSRPLHHTRFRVGDESGFCVSVGFPRSLAMSGRLRCGTVPICSKNISFEHKGDPPVGTAACFVLDTADLRAFLKEYQKYGQDLDSGAFQLIIPDDLCTTDCYRIVNDEIEFMDRAAHERWLSETGYKEYWLRGGEVFKEWLLERSHAPQSLPYVV